ncbi:DivIVA domain-containing protein [Pontibacter sp. G13]|uniref:DivIVA domain-containing protein n=1 Tax=Pontibacter sp. G13 TaxID=3074898 RepID=UPI00288C1C0F|nr:DivIVA domain-containing protein [Pontibacter sp. G13]WNJ20673.1 DivIVA domain-containing protein [Pontibacter sp. G13]
MITPIEIRQQTFKKALRGYDKEEVRAFLQALSQEWEQHLEAHRNLKEELEKVQAQFNTLKEVEDMLHKTLMQAEQSSKDTIENAKEKAELKIREAETTARDLVRQGMDQRSALQAEVEELTRQRDKVITQLQVFLKTQLDRISAIDLIELPPNTAQTPPPTTASSQDNFFDSEINGAENSSFEDIIEEL